ncbi:GNAT family N-acetyltransferase [Mangrovimonas futianensis]|uniref:GNAT family N-acetyltransferase n=1 Tax=Mangrovimonas futianensis TaxID=2895523 RepID=UPI001E3E68AC|nr:GNAT family N-acetyltransferase [Mangrovimonas futianensis]MCF1422668.1 GNAT family N-acetyltransferase [Mangrovimonas futianensis]
MLTLKGDQVYLRALEPEDLEFIYEIENDETVWEVSLTQTPYSRYLIKQYLENAHKDIYEVKQLRLVICLHSSETVGLIDLFDFDVQNKRAGVGILINSQEQRYKGFGKEALQLIVKYCKKHLGLHQLYCNIAENNKPSLKLFQNQGFEIVGLKKDWNLVQGAFKNEYLLQHIL